MSERKASYKRCTEKQVDSNLSKSKTTSKINSRAKGVAGEREWSSICKEQGYNTRRGQQFCGNNGDADVVGIDGVHMEIKRVQNLNISKAIKQAVEDSRESEIPIVAHRKNGEKWLVTMRAEDWFEFLREWNSSKALKEIRK